MASIRPFQRTVPRPLGRQCLRVFSTHGSLRNENDQMSKLLETSRQRGTPGSARGPQNSHHVVQSLNAQSNQSQARLAAVAQRAEEQTAIQTMMTRHWEKGDIYAPHDLSPSEADKWKAKKRRPRKDVFDILGINPLNEYKNFSVLAEFTTETGRVKHPSQTGLRPKNQRKIAKAIRRAIGIGLIPSVHKHPELIRRGNERFAYTSRFN